MTGRRWWMVRLLLFAVWMAAVLFMVSGHVYWRDEVRALSIALQGDDVGAMLRMLRGEGHPALWYLLLRGVYSVLASPAVLSVVALLAFLPAVVLLVFVSPFPVWLIALILATGPFLFEYVVMARNYGISVSLMFGMAALYPRWRERGVWLGLLAALLANTNVHSLLLAAAFMIVWLVDLVRVGAIGWNRATLAWVGNGAVALAGAGLAFAVLYPPVHDAVLPEQSPTVRTIASSLLDPASRFTVLSLPNWLRTLDGVRAHLGALYWGMSAVMFGSVAGLFGWAGGFVGGLLGLAATSVFFEAVYGGSYRHQALWLCFMIALYWIDDRRPASWVRRVGFGCLLLLLALQVPVGVLALQQAIAGDVPFSQVRNLAAALAARPDLRDAILIPDPDPVLEGFPAYGDNRIYLPRPQRFSAVSRFTRHMTEDLSLEELLREAERLCQQERVPVVLVIHQDLAAATLPARYAESYHLSLSVSAASLGALTRSTEHLGRFAPAASDESFDAYALRPPCGVQWSG